MNKKTVQELCDYKNQILKCLESIENILRQNKEYEKEYYLAHSHYIPQIVTALINDSNWLPRGEYTLQDTIDNLNDQISDKNVSSKGVKKYIF
jgi:hypothetical protein